VTAQYAPRGRGLGQHVPALDGLRGIAILFVMTFHYVTASGFGGDAFITRKIQSVAVCMWSGVDLFFVLSGFLITGILLRAKSKPGYFRNFYMRRVLRIFPLYYGALVVILFIVPHLVAVDTPGIRRIFDAQGWLWAYSEDIAIAVHNDDFFDTDWICVGHFWSLAVEEHFYLVWPLVVWICNRRALLWTSLGLIVVTPLVRFAMIAWHMVPAAVYTLTLCRTDELAVGGLLALLAQEGSYERLVKLARWGGSASALYLLAVVALRRQPFYWDHWSALGVGFSALAAGAGALVIFALAPERNWLRRMLENRVLMGFGKYSYGAYVFHTPLQPLYLRLFPPQRIADLAHGLGHSASRVIGLLGFAAVGMAITMLLAMASFFAYETPFLKLKRYFEYDAPIRGAAAARGSELASEARD
jgi:peptidoglycan/LPS O-acetylase OafA/YrhL